MRASLLAAASIAALAMASSTAPAATLSTSIASPAPLPQTGIVEGTYPQGGDATYYFGVDLKPGDLVSQIAFMGRPSKDKKLELALLNAQGREVGSYYVMGSMNANEEAARAIPVDSSGRYVLKARLVGPETTSFRIQVGGNAVAALEAAPAPSAGLSQSFLAPLTLPKTGIVTGRFPGGDMKNTYYYLAADLKAGDLMTQVSYAGRANVDKYVELSLLDSNGRQVKSAYVQGTLDANGEVTRSFPVDATGRYVLRVGVKGAEGTTFKVEVGGSALPQ
jgi:hypothetical protein